jgi:amidase
LKKLSLKEQGALLYTISAQNKPRLYVERGETFSVETEDAFSGQIRKDGDMRDLTKVPYGNPQSGPIYVNDAKPGDTLALRIENIEPLIGQGATRIVSSWYTSKSDAELTNRFLNASIPHGTKICKIVNGIVEFDRFRIPYKPMIGTVSTAHPIESYLAWFPGPHGGNMDIPEIGIGATVYLPVRVEGALLHIGDAHAVQGEGELSGAAVEMPALTTLNVDLVKKDDNNKAHLLNWPRLETKDDFYVIVATETGRPFEEAMRVGFLELAMLLEEDYAIERWLAFELLTMVSKIRIGNFWTVAVGIPKRYLPKEK